MSHRDGTAVLLQKRLDGVEKACNKALEKFRDSNSFYRSAGARELVSFGKEGLLKKMGEDGGSLDSSVWNAILRVAVEYQNDYDTDVQRFTLEVLQLMGATPNNVGIYEYRDDDFSRSRKKRQGQQSRIQASIKEGLSDGQPVYHSHNPWRAALLRSLRNNRTVPCRSIEIISLRDNQTRINRVVKFRGFCLEAKGRPKDRLYTVVDGRIEKAEQNEHGIENGAEAVILWRFKLTEELYTITGNLRLIKAHQEERIYQQMEPIKIAPDSSDEADQKFRRIAWNMCSEREREMFFYPERQSEDEENMYVKAILHKALQGLCINLETFEARDPADVFKQMDLDGSGMLDYEEFVSGLRKAHVIMDEADIELLFNSMDVGRCGEIEYTEFTTALEKMEISPTFWVQCFEPFKVERVGKGGAYGDKKDMGKAVFHWNYDLQEDGTWDYYADEMMSK